MNLRKINRVLTLGLVGFSAGFAQTAFACPTQSYLIRKDFAAADVVFEGTVAEVHPTFSKISKFEKSSDRVIALDITFNVKHVIRGSMDDRSIRVGWIHGTFGYPSSIEQLHQWYGENLRVGLITPEGMTDDCSRDMMVKTETGFDPARIEISCKAGYRVRNSADERSGLPSDRAFILNGPCTGPYMFDVTSVMDDPTRDLSKFVIGDEGFQLANGKEVHVFTRTYIKENPELAARFNTDENARETFMRDLSAYANFDMSRLDPIRGLTQKEVYKMTLSDVEAYRFRKMAIISFENHYAWYLKRKQREEEYAAK